MADKCTLGELIRDRRVGLDIGLRELARRLGVTPSYVSDIENNRRVPSEEVLHGIARELDLDFGDLAAHAGRIGAEAERYLRENPAATTLFRRISEEKLTDEEVRGLLDRCICCAVGAHSGDCGCMSSVAHQPRRRVPAENAASSVATESPPAIAARAI